MTYEEITNYITPYCVEQTFQSYGVKYVYEFEADDREAGLMSGVISALVEPNCEDSENRFLHTGFSLTRAVQACVAKEVIADDFVIHQVGAFSRRTLIKMFHNHYDFTTPKGELARRDGKDLPLQPIKLSKGWAIGTKADDGFNFYSRESIERFQSWLDASNALDTRQWTQRQYGQQPN